MEPFHEKPANVPSTAGYTFIEILIAIAIFSIGIMAISALQAASLKTTGNIGQRTQAWALLDERAEALKVMPFYANDDGIDNDRDGIIDELTEEMPELAAGNYNTPRANGRYDVHWQVANDVPIPQQNETVLPGVPVGNFTVSKTVSVQVTLAGGNPATDALAEVEFVKTWAAQGIP